MNKRSLFLMWGIVFLLSLVFPPIEQEVELAVIGTALGIGLAAAAAGGSVASGLLAQQGAKGQARAAERSSAAAIAEQRRQFNITQGNLAPFLGAGTAAVQRLQFLLGLSGQPSGGTGGTPSFGPQGFDSPDLRDADRFSRLQQLGDRFGFDVPERFSVGGAPDASFGAEGADGEFGSLLRDFSLEDFEADPGFEFRLAEGRKALERSAAARGGLLSGGTLKSLERFAQGTASQEFGAAFNRFQANRGTRFNFLANLAGLGETTGAQLADLGERSATNIGNLTVGGATSAAAARASGFSALGQSIGQGVNTGLNFLLLSRLAQQPQRTGTATIPIGGS